MPTSKNQNYLHGAAILTAAVAIVKILGAVYKIPMGNILDKEGFAYFNIAHNLYSVLLALSTAGLPIALARIISEANNLNRPAQIRKNFSIALIAFIVLGTAGTLAMFMFPNELAYFMGNIKASQSVQALAPSILLVCVMSAFRGYTQGLSDMRPTAFSQVIEVAAKVVFGIGILLILKKQGASNPVLSAGAISGVAVGSLIACVYIGVVASRRMKFERLQVYDDTADMSADSGRTVLKNLVKIGIPIALGSCFIAVITLVNTKLILNRLEIPGIQMALSEGMSDAKAAEWAENWALERFGVYSMAFTLYNLPAAIITPLTISVIPAISGFLAIHKKKDAREVIESSLRISSIIALPMAVGLSALASPIMVGLYGETSEGAALLAIMGPASYFVCLALMTTAILQAGGQERLPMINMLIGGGINIVVNYFLLAHPSITIYGAPLGTLISYIVMSLLNIFFILVKLPVKPKLSRVFFKPLVNSLVMGGAAWLSYPAVLRILGAGPEPSRIITIIALGAAVAVGVGVYLVLTVITRAITIEDMKLIPKGEKLARLLRIK